MAYEEKKKHAGKTYSGMRVGGVHRWDYPDGDWWERKREPSLWEFTYACHKRRKAKAPKGSGAGVGSGYHWAIVAHQWVRKSDANTYATFMEGHKHLLSFQKPDWGSWNTQFRNQPSAKQKMIRVLERELESLQDRESMEEPGDLPELESLHKKEGPPPIVAEIQT